MNAALQRIGKKPRHAIRDMLLGNYPAADRMMQALHIAARRGVARVLLGEAARRVREKGGERLGLMV